MSTQSEEFGRVIAHALACTVEIRNGEATGAGCILHPDGLVITGRHVVERQDGSSSKRVQVALNPGTKNEAIINGTIFYSDRKLDLALLWLNKESVYPAIPIVSAKNVKHAQTVYAIGSPGNLANTVSRGIVSNPHGRFNDVECIQTDAAIDHGNSGGPLINEHGELLGIILWGLEFDAAKFAVPVDYVQSDIDEAIKAGKQKCLDAYYCPLCGFNDPLVNHPFCRNCGAATHDEPEPEVGKRDTSDPKNDSEQGKTKTVPRPQLPNVRLTPNEIQVVYSVMSRTDAHGQMIYKYLLEKWQKAGFTVAATNRMITLNAPYGDRGTSFAWLLPADGQGKARIGLLWDKLKKYTGFPKEAVDKYQGAIQEQFALRLTQSAAYFEVDETLTTRKITVLVKEMAKLGARVVDENIEPVGEAGPGTIENVKSTLEKCSEGVREIFALLMDGWNAAGGTILCNKPGRIYLRMKTRAHQIGRVGTLPRNFTLVILAGPKGKTAERIEVTQGLADENSAAAYLDCIPEEVADFDAVTTALPGFEQHGTSKRISMAKGFAIKNAKELMKQMLVLKLAEEKAP